MTHSELVEASTAYFSVCTDMLSLYLTVTSGYLIVSYLAGAKLTRPQVSLITALYLLISGLSIFTFYGWGMRGVIYAMRAGELDASLPIYGSPMFVAVFSILLVIASIASIKFMWDVRHQNRD